MAEFHTSDGLRLYFEDRGTGAPVLCLAGLTRNGRDFDYLAPHLGDCRVITLDARGRGASDFDANYTNYNVMRESKDAVELLDFLGLGRVTVIGTSRGGMLAMMLAAGHGDRISGVVLNDVGPVLGAAGLARILDYVGQPPESHTLSEAAEELRATMGATFPGTDLLRWRQVAAAIYAENGDGLALRYDPNLRQALAEQLEAGPPGDLWPLFDTMRDMPVGVIRGANSDILTDDTLAQMRVHNPDLIAATVPDRGHAPFLDEPESLAVIRRVLERI